MSRLKSYSLIFINSRVTTRDFRKLMDKKFNLMNSPLQNKTVRGRKERRKKRRRSSVV